MTDFTDAQRAAIETRGAPILVSAGAGSGKTTVLVERLMNYISEGENPPGIDSFLVITYTRAAAAELRARITARLSVLIAENPESRHLRRQVTLISRARIETIHKFCGEVLRAGGQDSPLGAGYSIVGDARAAAIKKRVFDNLIEEYYADMDSLPGVLEFVDTIGAGRNDKNLEQLVYSLHEKIISHPYPDEWLGGLIANLESDQPSDITETSFGQTVLDNARQLARYWEARMTSLYSEIEAATDGAGVLQNYGLQILTACDSMRDFIRACSEGWNRACEFHEIRFDTLGRKSLSEGHELRDYAKSVIDRCKKRMQAGLGIFKSRSAEIMAEENLSRSALSALCRFMGRYEETLRTEMQRLALAEFTDLEHFALKLLADRETGEPTELACRFSDSFTEVMVDEYQDVSKVQDIIMRAVSNGGQKLFMVGDVKQSIYRFRLAEPALFIEKYRSFKQQAGSDFNESTEGIKILMNENFRSRSGVIDAINDVFERIMSDNLGELDYGNDEKLLPGAAYPAVDGSAVELAIIDVVPPAPGEVPSQKKIEAEALYIAGRIKEFMHGGATVFDGAELRAPAYSDIAVLMRSPAKATAIFGRVFARYGIPVRDMGEGEFLKSEEIITALSFLRIIRNPRNDVGLVSALRSPVFAFEPDELAAIRGVDPESDMYGALQSAAQENEKCAAFLATLGELRAAAEILPLPELLWRLYDTTRMLAVFSAMPGGSLRRENLMRLFEYAVDFESDGYRGTGALISELEALAENGREPQGAARASSNGVTILSVHKSKGLEFPIVFLAGTARTFNTTDLSKQILCHPQLGMGMTYTDFEKGVRYPSLAHHAIKARLRQENLSEEMRILYVAMTRARERLIITYAESKASQEIGKPVYTTEIADAEELMDMTCSGKWLIAAAAVGAAIKIKTIDADTPPAQEGPTPPLPILPDLSEQIYDTDELQKRLEYRYPHAAAASLPSKLTATGIGEALAEDEDSAPLIAPEYAPVFRLPDFVGLKKQATGAERGTAAHLVMQHIDFAKTGSVREIEEEVKRLAAADFLTSEQAEIVDAPALHRFFGSELGRRVLASQNVLREFRFSLLVSADALFEDGGGDEILLQGVVDLCIEEEGKLTVVDFKTDYVTAETLNERLEYYDPQIKMYSQALHRITGKPVVQTALCFLRTGDTVFLD